MDSLPGPSLNPTGRRSQQQRTPCHVGTPPPNKTRRSPLSQFVPSPVRDHDMRGKKDGSRLPGPHVPELTAAAPRHKSIRQVKWMGCTPPP